VSRDDLLTRGIENVLPRALAKQKLESSKAIRLYWGIDPTGRTLHLGHSVPLRKLRAFADAGHDVVIVIGSFTATIGDPTGQDTMRVPLTRAEVEANFESYKDQVKKILDFTKVEVRYNHEWLEKLTFGDIAKLASNFTVQQMSERDMFARRLKEGKPVGMHEFLYPLMVGYDSVILNVDAELGGSDQEFNMLAGRTLQKAFGKREKFIITTKIVEGTDGRKMSKSFDNCVYLTDSPKDMYGKILSLKDSLIPIYMECCTDIPMEDVKQAERDLKAKRGNPKDLKMHLAREIVTLYHGREKAIQAEEEFERVFREKGLPDDMKTMKVEKGSLLIDVLVDGKLASSKNEAKRLMQQGGVKVNAKVVKALDAKLEDGITPEALESGVIVKVGKRKFLRVKSTHSSGWKARHV
jgi:tyrosyl-tRNA synthetase